MSKERNSRTIKLVEKQATQTDFPTESFKECVDELKEALPPIQIRIYTAAPVRNIAQDVLK